jgi:hypothetical protein
MFRTTDSWGQPYKIFGLNLCINQYFHKLHRKKFYNFDSKDNFRCNLQFKSEAVVLVTSKNVQSSLVFAVRLI